MCTATLQQNLEGFLISGTLTNHVSVSLLLLLRLELRYGTLPVLALLDDTRIS